MRTIIKNIKSLLQVENNPRLRVCGADMAHIDHIEDAYLIQEGYLQRTPRGREATQLAYQLMGKLKPGDQPELGF